MSVAFHDLRSDVRTEVVETHERSDLAAKHGLQDAFEVVVRDPYDGVDPEGAARVDALIADLMARAAERRPVRSTEDPDIAGVFFGYSPGVEHWRTFVPKAAALEVLYDPTGEFPDGTPIDEGAGELFRHTLDAKAVRSRGAVVEWLLERLSRAHLQHRWVSLACGAARPVCQAAAADASDPDVDLTVIDWDAYALDMAAAVAKQHDVADRTRIVRANVLDPVAVHAAVEAGTASIVEAIGFFEYLPTAWNERLTSAAHFLELAASLLEPGGTLMYANMLRSHPQLDVTLHAARWPGIIPRSIEEILEISDAAGLPRDRTTIWLPDSQVTCIVTTTVD